jgi:hypothetical protein
VTVFCPFAGLFAKLTMLRAIAYCRVTGRSESIQRPFRGGGRRVKQAQEWLSHSDPATTLRHHVRLTTAARAKAVAGLDEVTRAALEAAEDAQPVRDNVVALSSRRR